MVDKLAWFFNNYCLLRAEILFDDKWSTSEVEWHLINGYNKMFDKNIAFVNSFQKSENLL